MNPNDKTHEEQINKYVKNQLKVAKENRLANEMIKELQDAGCTPEQMLKIIKLAKEKYVEMKRHEK